MLRRIWFLINSRCWQRELEEEMQFHAEQAGARFGDVTRWRERSRDEWGWRPIEELGQDIRYALRSIRRQPGFAMASFLLLALGVGANSAIFSVVHAVILSSLPVRDPGALVQLGFHDPAENEFRPNHTDAAFQLFTSNAKRVRDLFGFSSPLEVNATVDGGAELSRAIAVTTNTFVVLGISRPLQPSEVVLTHRYWQRRFGRDPAVVGRTLVVNAVPFTIAGVLPSGFNGMAVGENPDLFFHADRVNEVLMRSIRNPGSMWLRIMGRLQPGSTAQQAVVEMQPLSKAAMESLYAALPAGMLPQIKGVLGAFQFQVIPAFGGAYSEFRGETATALIVLLSGAALLLLVACANLAGLSLARSIERQREFGIRVALGCGRARLLRQVLTESALIAVAAGCAALLIEPAAREALLALLAGEETLLATPDPAALTFLVAITVIAAVLVGALPAWRAFSNARLVDDRMARTSGITRVLIASQVALSLILVAGAAMFTQTFRSYRNIDPGFRRDRLVAAGVDPGTLRYNEEQLRAYYRDTLERLRQVPGVVSATISRWPMGQLNWTTLAEAGGLRDRTSRNLAGSRFASTMGLRIVAGRDLSEVDVRRRTALVNQSFVQRHFPTRNPLGEKVRFMNEPDVSFEIVGVVSDARDRGPKHSNRPVVYTSWENDVMGWMTFSIHTERQPEAAMAVIRETIRSAGDAVPVTDMQTSDELTLRQLRRERMMAALGGAFGGLALAVAAVGLYALLAHWVARRTREIGLRVAIGASRNNVIGLVVRQCLVPISAGVVTGLPLAAAAGWAVRNQLYGVQTADPVVLGSAVCLIAAVASIASAVPASRAAGIHPAEALRHE